MFTRIQYINDECSHDDYYSQFVDDSIKNIVLNRFSLDVLKSAYNKDIHFNSLPLKSWDAITYFVRKENELRQCGDYPTLAGNVCILKCAARILAMA